MNPQPNPQPQINVINVPILTELTPQQVYLIKVLEALKVFEMKSGSVIINFNAQGGIGSVEKKEIFRI